MFFIVDYLSVVLMCCCLAESDAGKDGIVLQAAGINSSQ